MPPPLAQGLTQSQNILALWLFVNLFNTWLKFGPLKIRKGETPAFNWPNSLSVDQYNDRFLGQRAMDDHPDGLLPKRKNKK